MSKIAIVFWSGTGNTETMANCIAEGAQGAGAEVDLIQINSAEDFTADQVGQYDAIAFGCSSQGSEQLEEESFEPMFAGVEGALSGKKVALFGSYGWGDGQWMRDWKERCDAAKAILFDDGLTINEAPSEDGKDDCREMGKALAGW